MLATGYHRHLSSAGVRSAQAHRRTVGRGMAIRVIQWATGGVGRAAVAGVIAHPDLELVGCWVHNADKVGGDVGELCGVGPLGIEATDDIDELLGLDADCVIYSPFMADPRVVRRILTSGTNVVTPLNWFYPGGRDESRIEAACACLLYTSGVVMDCVGVRSAVAQWSRTTDRSRADD